ncbi:MAG: Lrp/AsnC family transcriptional regulator [Candidatus Micrarchaeota archaeon]|nr:Lrp/AsnC family transcriptional regulator [Candidatus Micrarchaeota archaeon]
MDEKDEVILEALIENSRVPLTRIASTLNISETAVRKRIKKLEGKGIIRAYTIIVDPFYLGYAGVALVGVDAAPERIVAVFEEIKGLAGIRYSAMTSGDHMMMFEVWYKSSEKLNKFILNLEKMEGVTRVCPAIYVKRAE